MSTALWPSADVCKSVFGGYAIGGRCDYLDAVLDGSDTLWVARSVSDTQSEISYLAQIYATAPAPHILGVVDGGRPVWLKMPGGTIYLFCGGASFLLDPSLRALQPDTIFTYLAALDDFWTWAWRGDELWVAKDGPDGLDLFVTRDVGRTTIEPSIGVPSASSDAQHPRLALAQTGEMVLFWWEPASLRAAATRNFTSWITLGVVAPMPLQWVGALFLDQKLVISFVDEGGTVQRLETDSLTSSPGWT